MSRTRFISRPFCAVVFTQCDLVQHSAVLRSALQNRDLISITTWYRLHAGKERASAQGQKDYAYLLIMSWFFMYRCVALPLSCIMHVYTRMFAYAFLPESSCEGLFPNNCCQLELLHHIPVLLLLLHHHHLQQEQQQLCHLHHQHLPHHQHHVSPSASPTSPTSPSSSSTSSAQFT